MFPPLSALTVFHETYSVICDLRVRKKEFKKKKEKKKVNGTRLGLYLQGICQIKTRLFIQGEK